MANTGPKGGRLGGEGFAGNALAVLCAAREHVLRAGRIRMTVVMIILFIGTLALFGVFAWIAYRLDRARDREAGRTGLTGNQWRLLAYGIGILLFLIAAFIEWRVVIAE